MVQDRQSAADGLGCISEPQRSSYKRMLFVPGGLMREIQAAVEAADEVSKAGRAPTVRRYLSGPPAKPSG